MRKRVWWVVVILALLLAPIVEYLGSPLFINRRMPRVHAIARLE